MIAKRQIRYTTALVAVSLYTSGCASGSPPEPRVEYRTANVAVAVGCVSNAPAEVTPLSKRIADEQWNALAPGAKAEAVKAQAGERMNYEDRLRAATKACPPAKAP